MARPYADELCRAADLPIALVASTSIPLELKGLARSSAAGSPSMARRAKGGPAR